jgi:cysteine desulfuration protein SufE
MPSPPDASPINAALADLADDFDLLDDWEERYRHLIDLGRHLDPLTDAERGEGNKVRGCASQVWLVTEPQAGHTLTFRGDSDSDLVRGLIAVLIRLYSGRAASDILAFDIKQAFDTLGFSEAISSQRSNGFFSMVQRVRRDAEALAA